MGIIRFVSHLKCRNISGSRKEKEVKQMKKTHEIPKEVKQMKKTYEMPEMEIMILDFVADIVTESLTSGGPDGTEDVVKGFEDWLN